MTYCWIWHPIKNNTSTISMYINIYNILKAIDHFYAMIYSTMKPMVRFNVWDLVRAFKFSVFLHKCKHTSTLRFLLCGYNYFTRYSKFWGKIPISQGYPGIFFQENAANFRLSDFQNNFCSCKWDDIIVDYDNIRHMIYV